MSPTPPTDEDESERETIVPAEVIKGIEDILEGRTADGSDLDDALDL